MSNLGANSYLFTQHMGGCKVGAGITGRTATLSKWLGVPENTLAVQLCSVLLYCCNTAGLIHLCPYCSQTVLRTLNGHPILLIFFVPLRRAMAISLHCCVAFGLSRGEMLLCPGPLTGWQQVDMQLLLLHGLCALLMFPSYFCRAFGLSRPWVRQYCALVRQHTAGRQGFDLQLLLSFEILCLAHVLFYFCRAFGLSRPWVRRYCALVPQHTAGRQEVDLQLLLLDESSLTLVEQVTVRNCKKSHYPEMTQPHIHLVRTCLSDVLSLPLTLQTMHLTACLPKTQVSAKL